MRSPHLLNELEQSTPSAADVTSVVVAFEQESKAGLGIVLPVRYAAVTCTPEIGPPWLYGFSTDQGVRPCRAA